MKKNRKRLLLILDLLLVLLIAGGIFLFQKRSEARERAAVGEEALKENIRKVQEAGGHVTLYFQGHLMDITNDYYKKIGCRLAGKNRWGTPYYEFYPKFVHADSLRFFSRKAFTTVCPSCPEWHDLMVERAKWIHSLGADGILYDQIGGKQPYPCYDESHPHMRNSPSLSYTQGRLKLHNRIRAQVNTYSE